MAVRGAGGRPDTLGRRDLLKGMLGASVLGFPTIIPGSALGADGTTPPSDRITAACIGVGRMGGGHVRSFLRHEDVRVVAVCDVQEAGAPAREGLRGPRLWRSIVQNLQRFSGTAGAQGYRRGDARSGRALDALYRRGSGPPGHAHVLREAARSHRGRGESHSPNRPAARVVFQFGTQQRSSPYFRTACELVRNGRIGQLQKVVVGCSGPTQNAASPRCPADPPPGFDWDMWLGPAPWAPYSDARVSVLWLAIYDYGLGCIGGVWGVHDIDIAQWVNNSDHTTPVSVEGTGTIYEDDIRDTICTWDIEYTYANGVKTHLLNRAAAMKRYPQQWGGTGSLNGVVLIGSEGHIWVSREGIQTHPDSLLRAPGGPSEQRVIFSNDHERNFFDAIRTGAATISPIEAAAHDEMICQMGDIAVRLRRKLQWDPVKEEFIGDAQANRRLSRPRRGRWTV